MGLGCFSESLQVSSQLAASISTLTTTPDWYFHPSGLHCPRPETPSLNAEPTSPSHDSESAGLRSLQALLRQLRPLGHIELVQLIPWRTGHRISIRSDTNFRRRVKKYLRKLHKSGIKACGQINEYMCVCALASSCVYISICVCVCAYICMCVCMCVCMHACMHACM